METQTITQKPITMCSEGATPPKKPNPAQNLFLLMNIYFISILPGSPAFYKGLKPSSFLALFPHNIAMDFTALNATMPTTERASDRYFKKKGSGGEQSTFS